MKAVQPNPREVKRFINNVILAKAVFDKAAVAELIAVRALKFRSEWNNFLKLISPDDTRKKFLNEYKNLKEGGRTITSEEELDKLVKERAEPALKDIEQIYQELLKQGLTLRSFQSVIFSPSSLNLSRYNKWKSLSIGVTKSFQVGIRLKISYLKIE